MPSRRPDLNQNTVRPDQNRGRGSGQTDRGRGRPAIAAAAPEEPFGDTFYDDNDAESVLFVADV